MRGRPLADFSGIGHMGLGMALRLLVRGRLRRTPLCPPAQRDFIERCGLPADALTSGASSLGDSKLVIPFGPGGWMGPASRTPGSQSAPRPLVRLRVNAISCSTAMAGWIVSIVTRGSRMMRSA